MLKSYLISTLIINTARIFITNCLITNLSTVMHFYAFKIFLSSIKEFISYTVILNVIL